LSASIRETIEAFFNDLQSTMTYPAV